MIIKCIAHEMKWNRQSECGKNVMLCIFLQSEVLLNGRNNYGHE
jgi:hypothetical protein